MAERWSEPFAVPDTDEAYQYTASRDGIRVTDGYDGYLWADRESALALGELLMQYGTGKLAPRIPWDGLTLEQWLDEEFAGIAGRVSDASAMQGHYKVAQPLIDDTMRAYGYYPRVEIGGVTMLQPGAASSLKYGGAGGCGWAAIEPVVPSPAAYAEHAMPVSIGALPPFEFVDARYPITLRMWGGGGGGGDNKLADTP